MENHDYSNNYSDYPPLPGDGAFQAPEQGHNYGYYMPNAMNNAHNPALEHNVQDHGYANAPGSHTAYQNNWQPDGLVGYNPAWNGGHYHPLPIDPMHEPAAAPLASNTGHGNHPFAGSNPITPGTVASNTVGSSSNESIPSDPMIGMNSFTANATGSNHPNQNGAVGHPSNNPSTPMEHMHVNPINPSATVSTPLGQAGTPGGNQGPAPGVAFCRRHLRNRFSEAHEAVINDSYNKGYYACSRCFATGLDAQGLCEECREIGRATRARRKANIPPTGGIHGKGRKRGPRKDRDGASGAMGGSA
ncbi:hypothetical protein B0T20DRAFT_478782 [Sordaria brevicollis]|uniref:Uncharacterized protein n=1 Tax=Sordaria brevicollis TaxID=83679 RepID=A0AAE0PGD7_SORBR|nr:hypothetical protein B0T20DRAFT_478782 [Sordaria brevicollis]